MKSWDEITLVSISAFSGEGIALILERDYGNDDPSHRVEATNFDAAKVQDYSIENIESLFQESSMSSSIGQEQYSYIEELMESIHVQPRLECVQVIDGVWYQLKVKRSGIELRLSWNSKAPDSWHGVTELAEALEGLYRELNKDQLRYLR